MKALLILWPVIAFVALLPLLYVEFIILDFFVYGPIKVNGHFQEYAKALLVPVGHLFIFLVIGSIVLNQFEKVAFKSKKLALSIVGSGLTALCAQLYARSLGNGFASIDCADRCAHTLYASPGLPIATVLTWIALIAAFIFVSVRAYSLYMNSR